MVKALIAPCCWRRVTKSRHLGLGSESRRTSRKRRGAKWRKTTSPSLSQDWPPPARARATTITLDFEFGDIKATGELEVISARVDTVVTGVK
jgi:hypothetical protein